MRWHRALFVVQALSWGLFVLAAVISGSLGSLSQVAVLEENKPANDPSGWRSRLVLSTTDGHARHRQVNLEERRLVQLQRRGVQISGRFWFRGDSVVWAPNPWWVGRGAQAFQLSLDHVRLIESARLGRRERA